MAKIILAAFFVLLVCDCNSSREDIATNKIYYYTISSPSDSATLLVNFLKENLDNKRVAITHGSGLTWPYYKVIAPNEDLPLDSLMPPHHFAHVFKEKGNYQIEVQEYFIDIRVMIETDTLPNYELLTYKMHPTGLELNSKTGIHYPDLSRYHDEASLHDLFLKSIIRYSFK